MAVEQKKKPRVRVSKNKKKSWNKYCDIKDIEDFLEEKRFDERIGGAVSEKTDAELFCIQTDVVKEATNLEKPTKGKKLRCHQNIGSFSKVPPSVTVNVLPYSKKITSYLDRADARRTKKAIRNASNKKKTTENEILQVGGMFTAELRDIWNEKEVIDPEIEDLVTFRNEYTCKRTPNVPGHRYQKPSLLPSVEIPHSGSSYNPAYDEHQELLGQALEVEVKKQKEELHLKRVLLDMFPTKAEAPTQESILQEMSQGLFDVEEPEDKTEKNTFVSRNPVVSAENRITKSRHRRKKERKEQERLRLLEKLQRKRISEVYRIRSLKTKIRKEAEVTQQRVTRNLQRKIDSMYKPKTLSKHKYEAPDLEVNLTEDLCGTMRDLKTEGNLLEDRYKSLQRRNLIEPRERQKFKRKYKLKVQVKRNHRNFK